MMLLLVKNFLSLFVHVIIILINRSEEHYNLQSQNILELKRPNIFGEICILQMHSLDGSTSTGQYQSTWCLYSVHLLGGQLCSFSLKFPNSWCFPPQCVTSCGCGKPVYLAPTWSLQQFHHKTSMWPTSNSSSCSVHHSPFTSTWPHLRCDVGPKEGEY